MAAPGLKVGADQHIPAPKPYQIRERLVNPNAASMSGAPRKIGLMEQRSMQYLQEDTTECMTVPPLQHATPLIGVKVATTPTCVFATHASICDAMLKTLVPSVSDVAAFLSGPGFVCMHASAMKDPSNVITVGAPFSSVSRQLGETGKPRGSVNMYGWWLLAVGSQSSWCSWSSHSPNTRKAFSSNLDDDSALRSVKEKRRIQRRKEPIFGYTVVRSRFRCIGC